MTLAWLGQEASRGRGGRRARASGVRRSLSQEFPRSTASQEVRYL